MQITEPIILFLILYIYWTKINLWLELRERQLNLVNTYLNFLILISVTLVWSTGILMYKEERWLKVLVIGVYSAKICIHRVLISISCPTEVELSLSTQQKRLGASFGSPKPRKLTPSWFNLITHNLNHVSVFLLTLRLSCLLLALVPACTYVP